MRQEGAEKSVRWREKDAEDDRMFRGYVEVPFLQYPCRSHSTIIIEAMR
jgi:hypothetical protein